MDVVEAVVEGGFSGLVVATVNSGSGTAPTGVGGRVVPGEGSRVVRRGREHKQSRRSEAT